MEEKNGSGGKPTRKSLNMRTIFRHMMEGGYNPTFEGAYIEFEIEGNVAVLEYEEGVLAVRVFFSIEEEEYDLLLEASNATMIETSLVKPALLENMKTIMFSCETICDSPREFKKDLPRCIEFLKKAIWTHKDESCRLLIAQKISSAAIAATEERDTAHDKGAKFLS